MAPKLSFFLILLLLCFGCGPSSTKVSLTVIAEMNPLFPIPVHRVSLLIARPDNPIEVDFAPSGPITFPINLQVPIPKDIENHIFFIDLSAFDASGAEVSHATTDAALIPGAQIEIEFESTRRCGNNIIEAFEDCDGITLDPTKTCNDLIPNTVGTLSCNTDCHFDTNNNCTPTVCNDGTTEGNEECDPPDGQTCSEECKLLSSTCGNSLVEPLEDCDGFNLDGEDCVSFTGQAGLLRCTLGCKFDTSDCDGSICGNNIPEISEDCDDGNTSSNDDCLANTCKLSHCGDGILNQDGPLRDEGCDDGNTINGDGCNQFCMIELNALPCIPIDGFRGGITAGTSGEIYLLQEPDAVGTGGSLFQMINDIPQKIETDTPLLRSIAPVSKSGAVVLIGPRLRSDGSQVNTIQIIDPFSRLNDPFNIAKVASLDEAGPAATTLSFRPFGGIFFGTSAGVRSLTLPATSLDLFTSSPVPLSVEENDFLASGSNQTDAIASNVSFEIFDGSNFPPSETQFNAKITALVAVNDEFYLAIQVPALHRSFIRRYSPNHYSLGTFFSELIFEGDNDKGISGLAYDFQGGKLIVTTDTTAGGCLYKLDVTAPSFSTDFVDSDGDGVKDSAEFLSAPDALDTDGDGLSDGFEYLLFFDFGLPFSPNNANTNGNPDAEELPGLSP
jgi:cysteine-rich repeat protein